MAKEKCDRNCATCGMDNRSFCAVQIALANQELIISMTQEMTRITDVLASLFVSSETPLQPIPQEEDNPPAEPIPSGAVTDNMNNRRV